MQTTNIFAIFFLLNFTNGITILPDNTLSGITFQTHQYIYFQAGSKHLNYKFNLLAIKNIEDNINFIKEKCPNEGLQLEKITKLFNDNLEKRNNVKIANCKEITTPNLESLNYYIKSFPMGGCKILFKMESIIFDIEREFVNLKNTSLSNVFDIIPMGTLEQDIREIKGNINNSFNLPIFPPKFFVPNFIKLAIPRVQYCNHTMFVTFEIPYFENKLRTLYLIYPKPFFWNNEFYISKTNLKYSILDNSMQKFYSETEYKKYCFPMIASYFCKNHSEQLNNCDKNYMKNANETKFNESCFTKMRRVNKITQIRNQLYFSILKAQTIYIKHGEIDYTITLNTSSKIIEDIDYFLKTQFFNYSSSPIYEIYESNEMDYQENVFIFGKNEQSKVIDIIYIIILFMLLVICTGVCMSTLVPYYQCFIEQTPPVGENPN